MPYVNVRITSGATQEQKDEIIRGITQLLVDVLNKKPEHTHIIIDEVAPENWGFDGVNTIVYRARQAEHPDKP